MSTPPIRARVDAAGRLVSADAALAGLQRRAGGELPGAIALPQLARLVELSLRFSAALHRPVLAADTQNNISFWARVAPDSEGAAIEATLWTERDRTPPTGAPSSPPDLVSTGTGWRWEFDERMTLIGLWPTGNAERLPPNLRASEVVGEALHKIFEPESDQAGSSGGTDALEQATIIALVETGEGLQRVELSYEPLVFIDGIPGGYRGKAILMAQRAAAQPNPAETSERADLDRQMDMALRAPVALIIVNAEAIAEQGFGPVKSDYSTYARDIAAAGKHLIALIDDLVDMRAIERADMLVVEERVQLSEIARQAATLLGMRANEKRMAIVTDEVATEHVARGEGRRVLQILINLVGNAVRYCPEGTMVRLSSEQLPNGDVAIAVSDQGPGLSRSEAVRVFDKFEQLGRTNHGGSGLGLYISRQLARAMAGDIKIDSVPGKGVRFTLTLPAWQ